MTDEKTQPEKATSEQQQAKAERGERIAENIRYGQTISEQGMGGKTTTSSGSANQGRLHLSLLNPSMRSCSQCADGYVSTNAQTEQDGAEKSRQEQDYGKGSGVGG